MSGKNSDANEQALKDILAVIDTLAGPDGCPWDQEQTPKSLCDYLAEETFELVEAIRSNDNREAMEELGDVMFILLFISSLYETEGSHSLADSLKHSTAKMIRRHPHVFAGETFEDVEEIWENWENTKRQENKGTGNNRVFDSLPKGLPPLLKAYRINSKAARNKFTWESDKDVETKLKEEWQEWQEAMTDNDQEASEKEFGDYLFTLVELARRKGIKANAALDFANQKFLARFEKMEKLAELRGLDTSDLSLVEMNALWDEVKAAD